MSKVGVRDVEASAKVKVTKIREWSNPIEFMTTCIGFAVGLGNVWRFPYLCFKNGGSAFVIAFLIMLFLVGMPIFFLDITISQFSGFGAVNVWKVVPPFKGIGICSLLVASFVSIYYNIIIAYSMIYLASSFLPELPWTSCNSTWNTEKCCNFDSGSNVTCSFDSEPPAKQYFENFVLHISDGIESSGGIQWRLALALFICWVIIFLALSKGVHSLGKVSYVTAIFPYIIIFILIIRANTLSGARKGLDFYIYKINWEKLLTLQTWIDATTQVYFCLGLIQGGLYTLGRHNKFNYNHQKTSVIIAILDGFTGILAGFAIFPVLGHMSESTNISIDQLAVGGPGLTFIVYPEALALMPFPWIFCVLFFIMMIIIGFGSMLGLMECVFDSIIELLPKQINSKPRETFFRLFVSVMFYIFGLSCTTGAGIYIQNLFDKYVTNFPIMICVVLEAIGIGWIYGIRRFREDIKLMLGVYPNKFWSPCFLVITPLLSIAILIISVFKNETVKYNDYNYPDWAHGIGWFIVGLLLLPIVIIFFSTLFKSMKKMESFNWINFKKALKSWVEPSSEWKPALETGEIVVKTEVSAYAIERFTIASQSNGNLFQEN